MSLAEEYECHRVAHSSHICRWLYATIGAISCVSLLSSNVSGSTKSTYTLTHSAALPRRFATDTLSDVPPETTVSALFFVSYAVGNLIGPQAFRSQDAPRYNPGLATSTAVIAFGLLDLLVIWYLYGRENKRRDKITSSPDWEPKPNQEFLDLTDRYVAVLPFARSAYCARC